LHETVDAAEFRDAMRHVASSVTVLTTDGTDGRAGLTVSSLCSLSMEPPSVLVCVHRESRALPVLLGNGRFVANVLSVGQNAVADGFAGLVPELREDRFASGRWSPLHDMPALEGAVCNFACAVADVFDFGSHRIIAGRVVGVHATRGEPLLYADRAYRQLAPGD
jgi:flavin reductase (DIM6/NTAB) family NADH-FMN oxidoreductase RutF